MRILITIEYDGTDYCGWQLQPNGRTVQEMVETALENLTGEKTRVTGSGRTDAGVHALGQTAHFETQSAIPPVKFAPALNAFLPPDIRVISSRGADGIHARFSAKRKTYRYSMYESGVIRPLLDRYAAQVPFALDAGAMDEAAKLFLGTHDFAAFMASGSSVKETVRTVYVAKVERAGELVNFTVTGNGFLYNMVRIMAGVLADVGCGRKDENAIANALINKDRSALSATMPARGLTLVSVEYCEKIEQTP